MTVCFFGNYLIDYPRVQVLRQGFLENNIKVIECHNRYRGFKKYWSLFSQHQTIKNQYDILIVMMGGQTLVWFARLLSKKKIIFDAFTSLYLANVVDRQTCKPKSFKAKYFAWLDKWSCQLADKVLLDTNAQIDYFIKNYNLDKDKFIRIFVGADNNIYFPDDVNPHDKFIIHWHGYIVPFYSLETVIRAAKILTGESSIRFKIVTRFNDKYKKIKILADSLKLNNVDFYPETNYRGIAKFINQSDICLGIFGNNIKARVVIPNKIYEAIACAKPVITARHKVISELFIDRDNIIMVEPENAEDLAAKILELKNDKQLRKKIADNCYQLYLNNLLPKEVVKELILI